MCIQWAAKVTRHDPNEFIQTGVSEMDIRTIIVNGIIARGAKYECRIKFIGL